MFFYLIGDIRDDSPRDNQGLRLILHEYVLLKKNIHFNYSNPFSGL